MTFLHPEFLYYMLPPLFLLFGLLLTQKEHQAEFFSKEMMEKLRVSANTLTLKARNALFFLIGFFMIIALAEPVIEEGSVKVDAKSADIMVALDISDSMLANDIYPNRLEAAKEKALSLLETAHSERIGIVAFAKESYLVSPLSLDKGAVSFLLQHLDTASITQKGTDFLSVLEVVGKMQKKEEKKYFLLLSDGGDKDDFSQEIESAKKHNITVFILAVATKKGSPVKLQDGSFIKEKDLDKYAFAYDVVDNISINSKVAYGVFPTMDAAKVEADTLSKNNTRNVVVIKKVKDVKKLHNDYQ